jgi:predicted AAA+ superfamily ATPase
MTSKEVIKDIIKSNEDFINNTVGEILPRHNIAFPTKLKKVKIIYGARRSGKTFLLYGLFRKNKGNALYIDFEDERLTGIELNELDRIRESFFELKPQLLYNENIIFLFDEIQNIRGWEKFARRLVEREGIDLYVAGSSSQITPSRISSSLRGREWSIALFPFSFKEFLGVKQTKITNSLYGKEKILVNKHLTEYLKYGGFPEVTLVENDFTRQKLLREYMSAMFFKDLVEQFNLKNVTLLETLKESLFSSFGAKFSVSSFYKQFKEKFPFSKTSLFRYYNAFLTSMLVFETRFFSPSAYKQRRNPPKIYLVDPGLAMRAKSHDWGRALENVVFLELKRRGHDIYYYTAKNECDFIIKENSGDLSAIQVAWEVTDENRQREYGGLVEACKSLKTTGGTIVTRDQDFEEKISGINVTCVPFAKWLAV